MTAGRPLDLGDCAEDSPYFRSRVSFYEEATDDLEKRLRRVGAICRERRELWKRDCALSRELRTLAEGFMGRHVETTCAAAASTPVLTTSDDSTASMLSDRRDSTTDDYNQCMVDCMEQTVACLRQLDEHRERFHEQVSMAVVEPLRKFVSARVQEVRTLGLQYREANAEAATAVDRLCACKRHELSAMAEASSALHEARLLQHIRACSYVHALNRLHSDKQPHFVQSMLDFVMCEMTTFRLGNSTFTGLDETVSSTYGTLREISDRHNESHAKERELTTLELASTITKRLAVLEAFHRVDLHVPSNTAAANMERMLADAKRRHHPILQVSEQVKMGRKSSLAAIRSDDGGALLAKSGYLFNGEQRSVVGVSWRRQFFEIDSGWLRTVAESDVLFRQFKVDACDGGGGGGKRDRRVVNFDLRLCLVKPATPADSERNFCFRVIHPSQTLLLQAESSMDLNEWMSSLHSAAVRALDASTPSSPLASPRCARRSYSLAPSFVGGGGGGGGHGASTPTPSISSASSSSGSPPAEVLAVEGNERCADCRAPSPRWASVSLGVTLCIECSGVHRSLGTHISQVRSMTLDEVRPEWTRALTGVGNARSNGVFEAFLPPGFSRQFATPSDRRLFIKQKYVEMVFAEDGPRAAMLAERELERSTLAQERERAEEERQQWELVEQAAAATATAEAASASSGTSTPAAHGAARPASSPSMFHRVMGSFSKH